MGERDWLRAKAIMESEPTTAGHLQEALGHLITTWNAAEKSARQLLETMIHSPGVSELTVVRLDAYGVEDTIRAAGGLPQFTAIRECLKEFSELFGQLREVRNHYVHGASITGSNGEDLGLKIENKNVRAKLRVLSTYVTRYDIYLTAEAAAALGLWALDICMWLIMARTGTLSAPPQTPPIPVYRKVGYGNP